MANEKVLILEAPWSDDIDDTQATRDIYTSAETLLRIGPDPARIIYRPLISTTYVQDVENFVNLDCNQSGPNVIILSAHGRVVKRRSRGRRRPAIRRELSGFDGEINLSRDVRALRGKLRRSIVILDSCWVGDTPERFRRLSGALAVVGFNDEVDWVDSSMFVLAMLCRLHQEDVLSLMRTGPRSERVITGMIEGPYSSLAEALGVETAFR